MPTALMPIQLPSTRLAGALVPRNSVIGVARDHVAAPAAVPPIVLPEAWTSTPVAFPTACVPVESVPIRLPATRLADAARRIPNVFPEMMFGPQLRAADCVSRSIAFDAKSVSE